MGSASTRPSAASTSTRSTESGSTRDRISLSASSTVSTRLLYYTPPRSAGGGGGGAPPGHASRYRGGVGWGGLGRGVTAEPGGGGAANPRPRRRVRVGGGGGPPPGTPFGRYGGGWGGVFWARAPRTTGAGGATPPPAPSRPRRCCERVPKSTSRLRAVVQCVAG